MAGGRWLGPTDLDHRLCGGVSGLPLGSGRGGGGESSAGAGETETLPFLTPLALLAVISANLRGFSACITGIGHPGLTRLLGTAHAPDTVLRAEHDLHLFNACKDSRHRYPPVYR